MSEVVSLRGPCRFCLNARCDPDGNLTDQTDSSFLPVGLFSGPYRLALVSGGACPLTLSFQHWMGADLDWVLAGVYYPRFCPECGRPLIRDYPEYCSVYDEAETE